MNGAGEGGEAALVTGTCALVSGATGFLGGHLAAELARRGWRVRALARPGRDSAPLAEFGVEVATATLEDPDSLARAVGGRQVVFHTAGKVTDWGKAADFFRTNVDGTANVISACRQCGVRRLVFLSSLTVLGLPRDGRTVDEGTPVAGRALDPYTASKVAAERRVLEANGQGGLETVVVRPGVIWGPGDTTFLPRFAGLLRRGRMVIVDGGRNVIALSHVANLVAGTILAGTVPGAAGQVYHLTDGEALTAVEAFRQLAAALGAPAPRRSLPFPLVYTLAALMEGWARLRRQAVPPPFTRYGVRLVSCDMRAGIEKARRELGYRPEVTFRQGIAALAAGEKP